MGNDISNKFSHNRIIFLCIRCILHNTINNFFLQDTAGSERYEAMSRIYYRGAKAAIVCYG